MIDENTMCIGITSDKRCVWQNGSGKPFISVHDAKLKQHLIEVDDSEIERIETPYTFGSLEARAEQRKARAEEEK